MPKFLLILCLAAGMSAAAAETKAQKKTEPAKTEALTGCVDQRGEVYVLAGGSMNEEAKLTGKAFKDENFARYIGHTVKVRGDVDRSVTPPVVSVVRIDEVSATCR